MQLTSLKFIIRFESYTDGTQPVAAFSCLSDAIDFVQAQFIEYGFIPNTDLIIGSEHQTQTLSVLPACPKYPWILSQINQRFHESRPGSSGS